MFWSLFPKWTETLFFTGQSCSRIGEESEIPESVVGGLKKFSVIKSH